jgi:hypothetical protein
MIVSKKRPDPLLVRQVVRVRHHHRVQFLHGLVEWRHYPAQARPRNEAVVVLLIGGTKS